MWSDRILSFWDFFLQGEMNLTYLSLRKSKSSLLKRKSFLLIKISSNLFSFTRKMCRNKQPNCRCIKTTFFSIACRTNGAFVQWEDCMIERKTILIFHAAASMQHNIPLFVTTHSQGKINWFSLIERLLISYMRIRNERFISPMERKRNGRDGTVQILKLHKHGL